MPDPDEIRSTTTPEVRLRTDPSDQPEQPADSAVTPSPIDSSASKSPRESQIDHGLLHAMRMARNCKSDWSKMYGTDCVRQCYVCRLPIVKLDTPTWAKISQLLSDTANSTEKKSFSELIWRGAGKYSLPDGRDLQLHRRSDGTFVVGDCYAWRYPSRAGVIALLTIPFLHIGFLNALAGQFLMPMLFSYASRPFLTFFVCWHLLGCWLFARTSWLALRVLIVIIFCLPLMMAPMLGPAIITIMQALGPVLQH
jgi:hypothetical protein